MGVEVAAGAFFNGKDFIYPISSTTTASTRWSSHRGSAIPRSGVVLIVCGLGSTMKRAQRQEYNRVRNVMIPNMYYREDIGDRWFEEDSDRLHSWGYLRE